MFRRIKNRNKINIHIIFESEKSEKSETPVQSSSIWFQLKMENVWMNDRYGCVIWIYV